MFNQLATNANKSAEPPLTHAGAPPDSERAKQPPLPAPYKPYGEKPARHEPPYKPYAEKPARHEPAYRPYAEKPALHETPYEPYKGI